jgi:hypothetical protein
MAAVVTVAIYNVYVTNTQSTNMTAGGGNMTKTMNSTHKRGKAPAWAISTSLETFST